MSHKRGRDKRADAKQSYLVPWRRGMAAQLTPLNRGMDSWHIRIFNRHIRPLSLFESAKWHKRIKRIIKNTENDIRLNGYNLPDTFGKSI